MSLIPLKYLRGLLPALFSCAALFAQSNPPRERLLFDANWKFHLGNDWGSGQNLAKAGSGVGPASMAMSDVSWRSVNLPHDWAIEQAFDPKADCAHGYKAVGDGFPENNVGWYRRSFEIPASDHGKRLWLEFDGVYRDATIFVNGWAMGRHESGYGGFRYDITDVANYGSRNVIAVRVDASQSEGWFYEGAGIYRHVWLVKTSPIAITPDGVFVRSEFPGNVPGPVATVRLQVSLKNTRGLAADDLSVSYEVHSASGLLVSKASLPAKIAANGQVQVELSSELKAPALWSPETPTLYTVVTSLSRGPDLLDRVETSFGVRTASFDKDRGFLLNGAPYTIKGTCNHQDHAGVGSALPDGLQSWRIARLKEMGSNGYRCAHNPPTPELLDACDKLGMLVMDENRLLGSDPAHMAELEALVLRDRNHPSVVIWSISNEEWNVQASIGGQRVSTSMIQRLRELDPTRAITAAVNAGNQWEGINAAVDVRGWNYNIGENVEAYRKDHPTQPQVGTEQGSTVSTRGIYANDKTRCYVSAYDDNAPDWAHLMKTWSAFFDSRPWLSGGFVWTGFDYRGEPTPYRWPNINSHFGILDTCGFAKDNFWHYKAWWSSSEPVLHLLPHWNWQGKEGTSIDVRALTNCDEVELFLNGVSQGRVKRDAAACSYELKWKVGYAPGVLSARGWRAGKEVAAERVETTGPAASVALSADRTTLKANGEDISVITVSVTDDKGRVSPLAGDLVEFSLEGPGRIIGVGNGDPSCHEPDTYVSKPALQTRPITGWRMKKVADSMSPKIPEIAVDLDESSWEMANVDSESGPLGEVEKAVFRCRFQISETELASPGLELWFGKIEGGGSVYVNGKFAGYTGDARSASIYDVKTFLKAGENLIVVTMANWGITGGLNKGVALRQIGKPAAVAWKRSVFNGLAQIIVQTSDEPGALALQAKSGALKATTLQLKAEPAQRRPFVP